MKAHHNTVLVERGRTTEERILNEVDLVIKHQDQPS